MANPKAKPTKPGGWVVNPRVRSTDILVWAVYTLRSVKVDGDKNKYLTVTSRQTAEKFWPEDPKGRLAEASSRLITLQKWGCLKVRVPNMGREKEGTPYQRHKTYYVSDYGLECAERWRSGAPRWHKR